MRDEGAVREAARGASAIFHLAMQHWSGRESEAELEAIAHQGLRNVLAAARAEGARLVHTSSTAAVGESEAPAELDEETWNRAPVTPYTRAKTSSERLLWDSRGEVDAVAVLPSMTIGPDDPGPTASNARVLAMYRRARLPFWFPGGLNVVDVRDVARGHLLAFERGRAGERYLLGGENLEYRALLARVRALRGIPRPPPIRIPSRGLLVAVAAYEASARAVGLRPFVTAAQLAKRLGAYAYYSSEKARRELGYTHRPLDDSLADLLVVEHATLGTR